MAGKRALPLCGLLAVATATFFVARSEAQVQMGPTRPAPDAQAVQRGAKLFADLGCAFCHGRDIRGGDGGPSLFRSAVVLNDVNGEAIGPVVRAGKENKMPGFELEAAQITDIAAFLHSFRVSGYSEAVKPRDSILVGDAQAGKAYFDRVCTGCHSASGDLAGLAGRYPIAIGLQQKWLAPDFPTGSKTSPTTIKIDMPDKSTLSGALVAIDEFSFTVGLADGTKRTVARRGNLPKYEVDYPFAEHTRLIRTYRDEDIHNVTAYLVTLK